MDKFLIIVSVFVLVSLLFYLMYQNKNVQVTNYTLESCVDKQIMHLSDIHNSYFGKDSHLLVDKINACRPDMILITGDLVDKRFTKIEKSLRIIDQIKDLAPIYFITGNHEATIEEYSYLDKELRNRGVTILHNEALVIDDSIQLVGLDDVNFYLDDISSIKERLNDIQLDSECYRILLSHKPHYYQVYDKYDFDLVLCGHAHGGQVRIADRGLYAPHQGVLPKYTSGLHQFEKIKMIISRGLGNSLCPLRVNNNPEIIMIKLEKTFDRKIRKKGIIPYFYQENNDITLY